MKFQLISVKLGKEREAILKAYPRLNDFGYKREGNEIFVTVNDLDELMDLIKKVLRQNCFICHDENVIHIYDEKLK